VWRRQRQAHTLSAARRWTECSGQCATTYQKHTNVEFVDFLSLVADAHPDVELHVVCDNYATHKHANVNAWLAENPRVTLHFTPTSCSWLNMVEIFFGIITKQAIRRGSFHSVDDLEATISTYIASYNERATPFICVSGHAKLPTGGHGTAH
jgi:transposase